MVALSLALAASSADAAEPVRVLLSIGANIGDPGDPPLRFAEDDAFRVAQLFVDIGQVASTRSVVVAGESAAVVRERLAEVSGRVKELSEAGASTTLIVYVSAHAKDGVLHLKGTHLPLLDLREAVAATRAAVKLIIVDTCDAGAIARLKGGTAGVEFDVSFRPVPLSGMAIIASSGPTEASQEWESLQGSLFTHHLLTGLRGDADTDGDGEVSLSEAYVYSWKRTVVNATRGGQHPAFEMDVSGTGDLILAQPKVARSSVILPSELEGRFVLASQPRADMIAEVEKVKGRVVRLGVPPGRYVLRKSFGAKVGLVSFDLALGGERTVNERELTMRPFAEVAVKGGFVDTRPRAFGVFVDLESPPLWGNGPRVAGGVAYRRSADALWLSATARAWGGTSQTETLTTHEFGGAVGVSGGFRFLQWLLAPRLGAVIEARVVSQQYRRSGEDDIRRTFGVGAVPSRSTFGLSFGVVSALELPMGDRWFIEGQLQGLVRWLPATQQPAVTLGGSLRLGGGIRW